MSTAEPTEQTPEPQGNPDALLGPADIRELAAALGVRPTNDAEGCLQDVHWAVGSFGYFPSYAIGAVIAGQLYEALRNDRPELDAEIAAGQLGGLCECRDRRACSGVGGRCGRLRVGERRRAQLRRGSRRSSSGGRSGGRRRGGGGRSSAGRSGGGRSGGGRRGGG